MNKLELIDALKDATDQTKPQAAAIVDTIFNGGINKIYTDKSEIKGIK